MEPKPQRTISQNRCLHLALTQISTLLVEQGLDQRTIIRDLRGYSAPVTPEFLKLVFKTIIWTMYRKESTTELTTVEMMNCFDVFSKFLAETYKVEVVWPSSDSLALQALLDSQN